MADRRMFSKKIVESDAFLDMPLSTQALYLHLNMVADDDGFVNSPKRIQHMIGATDADLKLLVDNDFLITFETGVVVIKHWKLNNYIAKDRYHETVYLEEKAQLQVKANSVYSLYTDRIQVVDNSYTNRIQLVDNLYTEVSIDKDSIDKNSIVEDSIKVLDRDISISVEPSVISFTLKDNSEYEITQSKIDSYKELYPSVDIMQEFREMKGWCNSNRSKRKTRDGAERFINNWLAKAQKEFSKKSNSKAVDVREWYK